MNIGSVLTHHSKFRPQHLALVYGDDSLTYKELNESVNQIAHAMINYGIRKGDKVTLLLHNCRELWELYWATAKIGAVCVPLNPLLRGAGLINQINNADTSLLITHKDTLPYISSIEKKIKLRDQDIWVVGDNFDEKYSGFYSRKLNSSPYEPTKIDTHPDDLYNIIYSSGTTGAPKGIMHSHRIRMNYMTLFGSYYRMTPESVVLHSGSIIFNGSFLTTFPIMFHGGTFVLHEFFDTEKVIEDIQKYSVTHTILVPTQIINALQHPNFKIEYMSSLECILSVGAPLSPKYKHQLNDLIPLVFYELYGLTEGFVTILDKTEFSQKLGSVGKPPQFFDMRIVNDLGEDLPSGEIGEIVGRGPILMQGYFKDEEKTNESIKNGWLYTGDLGYVDEEGYLFLVDRKKDMIISGAVNVYPKDIESVIMKNELVREVAVIGVEDPKWGETPVAMVVLNSNKEIDSEYLKHWINDHVEARFHKVTDVVILDELPRNVAGKILKLELKNIYQTLKLRNNV